MFERGQARWRDALKLPPDRGLLRFREFVEGATYKQRIGAVVELGRVALIADRDGEKAKALVSGLRQGQFADRYLALNSCHGSRDTANILNSVRDRSETLRAIARRMIAIYGSDEEIFKAFIVSAKITRKSFIKQLNQRRRFAVVDQILKSLEHSESDEFAALLPYGSSDFVRNHWPGVEADCTSIEWGRLSRNHQGFAQERIIALVDSTPEFDPRVRWHAVSVLNILVKARVSGAIELMESLLRICSISQIVTVNAVKAFPDDMARLAVDQEDRTSLDFFSAFSKISDEDLLIALMAKYPPTWGIVKILKKLPVVARRHVYEQLAPVWRSEGDGVIEEAILAHLPVDIRVTEARAHLAMESLSAHPQIRMQYAAFLPWSEALEMLKPYMRDPDAQLRSVAWSALIAALPYNRSELSAVLDEIKLRKKEQDPIKQKIFESLSKLPPVIFKTDHLTDLSTIIQDTLDSRDLSASTAYYIESVLLSMMPFHPDWSAKQVALFWRERGSSASSRVTWRINDEQALSIESQIVPVLKQWNKKEYETFVLTAAGLFGRRLEVTKQITSLVQAIVLDAGAPHTSERAFELLKLNAFERLAELVPAMLHKDASWGTKRSVFDFLTRYRQDLLSPYLGTKTHRGRFDLGKNRLVPMLNFSAVYLSSGQQKLYADALDSMSSTLESRRYENFFVIKYLAKIPDFPIKYLTRFLNRPAEAQMAILAIAKLDEGNGVPLLVGALEDPALASVAIYSLRSCLMKMPAEDAFAIIQRAPRNQVTVFKEVVRLLGDIKSGQALAELNTIAKEDIHRDVRVALLRAFWNHLEQKETWAILQTAVNDADDAVAYTAIRTPAHRLSQQSQHALTVLLLGGLAHQAPRVRLKTLERLCTMPVPDPDMELLDAVIARLGSEAPEECKRAAEALLRLYPHKALIALPKAVEAVIRKRSNLRMLIESVETALETQRSTLVPAAYATIATLEKDPLTLTLRARLAVESMPWPELAQWLRDLVEEKLLHPDALQEIGLQLLGSLRPDFNGIVELEAVLRNEDSEVLRRIALYALEAQCGEMRGWNAERLERLEAFRRDSSSYIAEVAQFILPDEEEALKTLQSQSH